MFNGNLIASVNSYNQGNEDKNGKEPVILNVVAGKCPNRQVLSGTVAENMNIEVGKTYLFNVREGEEDPTYGRRFVFNALKELDAIEILDASKKLSNPEVFSVEEERKTQPKEEYQTADDFQG